jgi:hypothetical protein
MKPENKNQEKPKKVNKEILDIKVKEKEKQVADKKIIKK